MTAASAGFISFSPGVDRYRACVCSMYVNLCEVDGCGTVELLGEVLHGKTRIRILNYVDYCRFRRTQLNRRLLLMKLNNRCLHTSAGGVD